VRADEPALAEAFRARALGSGAVAGALALAGLVVVHADAHSLYVGLLHRAGLAALVGSVVVGAGTMGLVWRRHFEAARYGAAVAVAAVIAGWAFARYPTLLPGLSVHRAAASHDTLVTLVVAVLAGGALLFPSLALLFSLTLRGQLHPSDTESAPAPGARSWSPLGPGLGTRLAVALLIGVVGFLNAADAPWAHAVGVVCLFAFVVVGFLAIVPPALADEP
jgi:cytochrome bd ubiquinol oxidase subunit II